jgi:hypothetical protein
MHGDIDIQTNLFRNSRGHVAGWTKLNKLNKHVILDVFTAATMRNVVF